MLYCAIVLKGQKKITGSYFFILEIKSFIRCCHRVCLCVQSSQEEQLKQKLLEEQFALLQGTVSEAESIIQDAVAKLDDPLHVRCTSSPGQTPALSFQI